MKEKQIKDVQTGDSMYVAFKYPESSQWIVDKIDIIEGYEAGWTFLRQDMQNTPIGFVGKEIYIREHEEELTSIKQKGVYFFTTLEEAQNFVDLKILKRSREIQLELQDRVQETLELAKSIQNKDKLSYTPINYNFYYLYQMP